MQRYQDNILNSQGQPVSGASVLVTPSGTASSTATLYGDKLGTATVANPRTTDSNGHFGFYAPNGRYDLIISSPYIATTTASDVMLEDVPLSNLAELSTASAARTNLGLDSASTSSAGRFLQAVNNLSDLTTASAARSNLGLGAVAYTTGSQTFTGAQRGAVVALASTGQITPNLAAANNFSLAMTVNTTLAAGTSGAAGQAGRIVIAQNSTAKTLAYDSAFWKFTATATLSTATTAGTRDVVEYYIMDSTSAACVMRNGFAG